MVSDPALTRIRKALADRINTYIPDDVNVAWYSPAGMEFPRVEIDVNPDAVNYFVTKGGGVFVLLDVIVEVDGGDDESIAVMLDRFTSWDSEHSIYAAVMDDRTLGGTVTEALVKSASRFTGVPTRVEFTVEIKADKFC